MNLCKIPENAVTYSDRKQINDCLKDKNEIGDGQEGELQKGIRKLFGVMDMLTFVIFIDGLMDVYICQKLSSCTL